MVYGSMGIRVTGNLTKVPLSEILSQLRWGTRFCISNKAQGDVHAAGPQTPLGVAPVHRAGVSNIQAMDW